MTMMILRGCEFREIVVRDSYNRKALQYKNKIINHLKAFGIIDDDIEIPLESVTFKKAQACASWYMDDHHLFFSYNGAPKFVENLAMVEHVIKHFIDLLIKEEITHEEFLELFSEDKDIRKQRIAAREVLEVEEDSTDFEKMHQNYKRLSKECHPDMPGGDAEKFKRINVAHKILRKEFNKC